ncbi:MAG: DUF2779 domain-containing protein [Dehalococcoidia bacterium]|nr:DUF2779 domain-containing protein [Dehalococcoidia bacterium]
MSEYRSLSKSRYLEGLQCRRLLWVSANAGGRLPPADEVRRSVFEQGAYVGGLAQQLFPGGLNLASSSIRENLKETKAALKARLPMFEAGFSPPNLYCRVDILNPAGVDGWDIVEVKASTEVREEHLADLAFQRHCCEKAGLKIEHVCLMHINKAYVRRGALDTGRLFIIEDVTGRVETFSDGIAGRIAEMLTCISYPDCPEAAVSGHCDKPYTCGLHDECWAFLPEHHVFTLHRGGKQGDELLLRGITDIHDIPPDVSLSGRQLIQRGAVISGEPHTDRPALRKFLEALQYPLHYMDFETFMAAVPPYDGTWPYRNIPFQFSLHVQAKPGAKLEKHEFLAGDATDPRPAFMAALREAVGPEGSILVYNESFEKARLEELVVDLPEYEVWVRSVLPRFVDLIKPFRDFHYYHPAQKGSASLKKVMPPLTGIGYDSLEIGRGDIAGLRFMQMVSGALSIGAKRAIRRNLLKYCGQDTSGMARIVEELEKESRRML